jgi:hypothetical protein
MNLTRYEISTERVRLKGRTEQRGAQTGFPTWGGILFGGVFVATGVAVALIGLKVIPVEAASVKSPFWVLTVFGLVFALAGLAVWAMAGRQFAMEKRRREAQRQFGGEPALADYNWDTRGFAPPRWKRAMKAAAAAAFVTLFLSIFNWWAFFTNSPLMVKILVGVFDLILLAVWWEAVRRIGQAMKFGGSQVVFEKFPYRRGAPIVLRWEVADGVAQINKGTFTLRCVEEWYETRGSGKNRSTSLVHEERWRATWHVDGASSLRRGESVALRFELPADAPATQLGAKRPVFWELEVKLDLAGLDFEETYLVPVY